MEVVVPSFPGPSPARVMSWVADKASEFFQTSRLLSSRVPAGGPWRGHCGQDALLHKAFKTMTPSLLVWFPGRLSGFL